MAVIKIKNDQGQWENVLITGDGDYDDTEIKEEIKKIKDEIGDVSNILSTLTTLEEE